MVARPVHAASVQEHHPAPDGREVVRDLEIVEGCLLGQDFFKQAAEAGDIPLAVAQVVDQLALSVVTRDLEGPIKGAVGRPDSQLSVENQQRLPHRLDNVLRIVDCVIQRLFRRACAS